MDDKKEDLERQHQKVQKVPFYKLFAFADPIDVVLMIVGGVAAIGNGLAQPLMTLVLGQIINSFGRSDPSHVVHDVSKVFFIYILHSSSFCFWLVVLPVCYSLLVGV